MSTKKNKKDKAKISEELNDLNSTERAVLVKILAELKGSGDSQTLNNLWSQDFEEVPVDIDTFIDDDYYLGTALEGSVYPFWRDKLRDIFIPNKYIEVIFSGAIGLGKSTIADIAMAYELYKLLCLKNPQAYYDLPRSTSTVTFAFFNASLSLADSVTYGKFQSLVQASPWFREHGTIVGRTNKVYIPSKGIRLVVGSKEDHALGQDVFCLVGSTKILTSKGLYYLEDLVGKDIKVVQLNSSGRVALSDSCTVLPTKRTNKLIKVTLEDGTTILGDPEHKVQLANGDYVKLKELSVDDELKEIVI